MRWIIGMAGLIAALILVVYGVARVRAQANRCVQISDGNGWRTATIDAGTGRILLDHRTKARSASLDATISPDGRYMLTTRFDPLGNMQLVWIQAYPPRTVILVPQDVNLGWVTWSPESVKASYVLFPVNGTPLATWNILDVRDGQVKAIPMTSDDAKYFQTGGTGNDAWSPDSRSVALARSSSNGNQARLYLRERDSTTMQRVDLPNMGGKIRLQWAPDGQTLVILGHNAQYPTQGLVIFYSLADGRIISRLSGDTDTVGRRLLEQDITWSPNGRYFYTASGISDTGTLDSWDVYGIDGSAYFQVVDGNKFIGWRQTDSRLVMGTRDSQLAAFDPATGTKTLIIAKVIMADYFQGLHGVIVAYALGNGEVAVDVLDLQTGVQTRVMSGTRQILGLESRATVGVEAVRWMAGLQLHLTFFDDAGKIRQDFGDLVPSGQIAGAYRSDAVVYAWKANEADLNESTLLLLNLNTGKRRLLMTTKLRVGKVWAEPTTGRIIVPLYDETGEKQQMFTADGDPVPLGNTTSDELVVVAPDGQHVVWMPGKTSMPIEIRSASGNRKILQPQFFASFPLIVRWAPDSSAVIVAFTSCGFGLRDTGFEVFGADGEARGGGDIMADVDFEDIQWTGCS